MTDFLTWLAQQETRRERAGVHRTIPIAIPVSGGCPSVDLAGNDYLGLSVDPRVTSAAAEAGRRWGSGAGASRVVGGTTAPHLSVEAELADFLGQPAALVFSSGYLANLGTVTALAGRGDLIVCDAHAHASLLDACRLSRARVASVDHLDCDFMATLLGRRTEQRALVITESLFSVLGDAAPLVDLAEVCHRHHAVLLVDEAHGIGVAGPEGRGLVAAAGLSGRPDIVVTATLSKALASQGGVVLGHPALRNHLINEARTFIYDTGLAPAAAAGALAALRVLREEPQRVDALRRVAAHLAAALEIGAPMGAVLSAPCAGPAQALAVAERCAREGVRVGCFRPPSVPDRVSRIRVTAKATLNDQEIRHAARVLRHAMQRGTR